MTETEPALPLAEKDQLAAIARDAFKVPDHIINEMLGDIQEILDSTPMCPAHPECPMINTEVIDAAKDQAHITLRMMQLSVLRAFAHDNIENMIFTGMTDKGIGPLKIMRGENPEPQRINKPGPIARQVVCFVKMTKAGGLKHTRIPAETKEDMDATFKSFSFPRLNGFADAPRWHDVGTVAPTVTVTKGYDPNTGYYVQSDFTIERKSDVTKAEAEDALAFLASFLTGFTYADHDTGIANSLAFMLTAALRTGMDKTPGFVITAPDAGSGKGFLVELVQTLVHGKTESPGTKKSDSGWNDKELGTRLAADKATDFVYLDEIPRGSVTLDATLRAMLTSPDGFYTLRIVGSGNQSQLDVRRTFVFTGNALFADPYENRRRLVSIDLMGKPKTYAWNPSGEELLQRARDQRGDFHQAVATLLDYWLAAGGPKPAGPPMRSFENWHRVIGGVLELLGITGLRSNSTDEASEYEDLVVEARKWLMDNVTPTAKSGPIVGLRTTDIVDALLASTPEAEEFQEIIKSVLWCAPHPSTETSWEALLYAILSGHRHRIDQSLGAVLFNKHDMTGESVTSSDGVTMRLKSAPKGVRAALGNARGVYLTDDPSARMTIHKTR